MQTTTALPMTPTSQMNGSTVAMETDSVIVHQTPVSLDNSSNSINIGGGTQTPNMLNTILNELNLKQQQQQQQNGITLMTPNFKHMNGSASQSSPHPFSATSSASSAPNGGGYSNGLQQQQQLPVTPSIRISALNYVGDALRKVTVSFHLFKPTD